MKLENRKKENMTEEKEQARMGEPDSSDQTQVPELDQAEIDLVLEKLRAEQQLLGGTLLGLVAAIVGAALWGLITVFTEFQIGLMAVGVGFLVGIAMRFGGKGIDSLFGIMGAILALIGCLLGNILAGCGFVASSQGLSFFHVLSRLTPSLALELLKLMFNPIDLLFYAIALYVGYRFSFRRVSATDIERLAGRAPVRN